MPRPSRSRAALSRGTARSLYPDVETHRGSMDDLIPALLSIVVPHVEALQAEGTTLAQAFGERLRRALVRMEPLLDEALNELKDYKNAQSAMDKHDADLRASLLRAQQILQEAGLMKSPPRLPEILISRTWLRRMERWEEALRWKSPQPTGSAAADRMLGALEQFLDALRDRERAERVLQDVHALLRVALTHLAEVGRTCERVFPEVATRVEPRAIEVTDDDEEAPEAERFDIQ
ncbi:MAG: hypothetical protein HY904_21165 [Deltaproteobacteria bacterium]|nr:hypothetical protein [Deltaproteobacteria bacterium]